MMQPHAALVQGLCHFDCAEGADVAIVVSTLGNRVDVGSQHDGFECSVGPGSCPHQVAGDVDADGKSCVAHQSHYVFAAGLIGGGVSNAAHAALRILAELGQSLEV